MNLHTCMTSVVHRIYSIQCAKKEDHSHCVLFDYCGLPEANISDLFYLSILIWGDGKSSIAARTLDINAHLK